MLCAAFSERNGVYMADSGKIFISLKTSLYFYVLAAAHSASQVELSSIFPKLVMLTPGPRWI